MLQVIGIGIGAGVAAALLFASLISGSTLAIVLCLLAPLPVLIAAIGWNHLAALIAVGTGTLATFAYFGSYTAASFLTGIGLPGWWLGYLALLARPVSTTEPASLEWYPAGNLVFWAALLGALFAAMTLLTVQLNLDSLRPVLTTLFERLLNVRADAPLPTGDDATRIDRLVEAFLTVAPLIAAATATLSNLINVWLAGSVVRLSGGLRRPWPDLAALTLPRPAFLLLLGTLAATWLLFPDIAGILTGVVAAALLVAFAVLGFAVLHAITRGIDGRAFVLAGAYVGAAVFWPTALLVALLGIAESTIGLRGRINRKNPPPPLRKP